MSEETTQNENVKRPENIPCGNINKRAKRK